MLFETRYIWVVAMDVDPEREDLFNEVYDTEHIPDLLEVEGVVSVSRSKRVPANLTMGGETIAVGDDEPSYIAYYEVDDPEVINSEAWAAAVDKGRWSTEVRPYTRNRHVAMHRVMGG